VRSARPASVVNSLRGVDQLCNRGRESGGGGSSSLPVVLGVDDMTRPCTVSGAVASIERRGRNYSVPSPLNSTLLTVRPFRDFSAAEPSVAATAGVRVFYAPTNSAGTRPRSLTV
jgi:hypothetical protein